ncbi:TonB-dependent receptor [uncultured Sphingomonas sp.]|uniref:TonB-dependent receptor n=1 Tax=uncultured Sphingomonas sp. TaxID=158754 RepID=UPI0025FD41E9|nr:TonB-dependent receptor [uncultured Sphingomonas sp.]
MKSNMIRVAGAGGACLMLFTSHIAIAQTAGTIAAEDQAKDDIVVTGQKLVATGIEMSNSPKARAVVTQDYIEHTVPGQSIFNAINLVPGVNYVASDPYGGNGGTITIRGFDQSRIAFTFDGLPLNDAGNYAVYSSQQVDPELVQSVNVSFGSTDVDTPTASASGGTVNYRTIMPTEKLSATTVYSHGPGNMNRVFGLINTGDLNASGTRAWVSASEQKYRLYPFAQVRKNQYNARIYQPLGSGKDFLSLAGFFYQHRNMGYGGLSVANIDSILGNSLPIGTASATQPLRIDLTRAQYDRVIDSAGRFLQTDDCQLASATPGAGTGQDDRNLCGNARQIRVNPVDTGNARFNSLFTLNDKLTLTIDGGYSYTLANGGGSTVFAESDANAGARGVSRNQLGRLGAGVAPGVDLNGDGDRLDYVRVFYPSNTQTHRLIAVGGLRYDIDPANLVRMAYTWDRARTAQTGEASFLRIDGYPTTYFGIAGGKTVLRDAAGNIVQKRNRLTYSMLHQLSGEYRGRPFSDDLSFTLGVRAALFRRNMSNACYTIPGSGSEAYCTSQTAQQVAANGTTAKFGAPYSGRIREYHAILPNAGLVWQATPHVGVYASYAKGFSAPTTDIYSYDDKVISLRDKEASPERTDSYDAGLRYNSGIVQAQMGGWYIHYDNRIVSTTVQLEGGGTISASRNVGRVDSHGFDATLSLAPTSWLTLYGFGSYLKATLRDDIRDADTGKILVATEGKSLVDTPNWQYGGRAQISLPFLVAGISAKHVGDRYVTDENDAISAGYTLVDLDAQTTLRWIGLDKTYFQLNVINLFDKRYYSNVWSAPRISQGGSLNFGVPRTVVATVHFQF